MADLEAAWSRRRRAAAAAVTLALLAGCAEPMLPALRRDEPPRIGFQGNPAEGDVKISNLAVGKDAGTGSGVGAVGGALWGLACGPWAPLCIPFTASRGSVAGAGAGATIGLTGSLPSDKAERLRARLTQVLVAHDLPGELRDQVLRRARGHWDLQAEPGGAEVTVVLQRLSLTSTRDEQIGLVLQVQVTAQRKPPAPDTRPVQKVFACQPSAAALAVWLDERNDYLDVTLSTCAQQVAAQIVGELARP